MKFTLPWLKEYLETTADIEEISNKLTAIGLEVENIDDQSKSLASFFVAKILSASPHPDSDKLQICQVDVGKDSPLQIICGAANARAGLKVAFAPIDSIIPTNLMKIKKSKILGVESHGMLCSAKELGLGDDSEGIIEIDDQINIGTKIADIYGMNISVIEINVTPNRGDCLGVYGVARDLAASGIGILKNPQIKSVNNSLIASIKVKIAEDAINSCHYFSGRYIKNISNCESPKWLKEKLLAIGVNSISAIVDITNYVMYSLNQPLHCYDADKISGDIIVRNAYIGENFESLKNQQYKLSGEELVIADQIGAIGLAGIIGGATTASSFETKNIFLEAAFFDAENISKTGRKLNILSDSRYRFERSIDPASVKLGLDMATNLILEICGGNASNLIEAGKQNIIQTKINFDLNKINKILGIEIEENEVIKILQNLGFTLQKIDQNLLEVIVPSFRSDITLAEDLVEEIIRIHGYNKINSIPLPLSENLSKQDQALADMARDMLCISGMDEIISWSFVNSKMAESFLEINPELLITNPISSDMDYMRPSLIIGLLGAVKKNKSRGFENLSFFEIGKIFFGVNIDQQKNIISGLRIGKNKERSHYKDERFFDVMDVKKDLFNCLELFGISSKSLQIMDDAPNYYHPYRSATVRLGKNIVGYFGELNPLINKKFDIAGRINVFEFLMDNLPVQNSKKSSSRKVFAVSDLQIVNRDFAFILDEKIKISELIKAVENCDKELISKVNIFDIYHGDKISTGKKSVALGVEIQPMVKTLTSEEIDQISNKIIDNITSNFGGVLRDY